MFGEVGSEFFANASDVFIFEFFENGGIKVVHGYSPFCEHFITKRTIKSIVLSQTGEYFLGHSPVCVNALKLKYEVFYSFERFARKK